MRKSWILLLALVAVLGFSGSAVAALTTIGTATYGASSYNLIYEDDQGLVWLDYTHDWTTWGAQMDWAAGLNNSGVLTYNLNPEINVNWSGDWRLPITDESKANLYGGYGFQGPDGTGYHNYALGYNMVNSEMGYLYFVSLGNLGIIDTSGNAQPGYGLQNTGPFDNLQNAYYWSGTEYSLYSYNVWVCYFPHGGQNHFDKNDGYYALAVRSGEVSAVPVPASIILLGSGLVGLLGMRRKLAKS